MFIFLSKFLPPFVYPLGLASILILLAIFLAKKVRWQRLVLIVALLIFWLGGNRWVAMELARSLEWRYLPPEQIPRAEVIVLLGGGSEPATFPRPMVEVNAAGDRVLYTAWLYQQGKADYILVSGGLLDWSSRPSTPAEDISTLLKMMGVPEEAIWLQPDSRNTYEDALYCAQILQTKGIQEILLVTSASHMPRAVLLFEAQGLQVTPLPTDYSAVQAEGTQDDKKDFRAGLLNLLPSAENLALTTRVLKEYLGLLIYKLRGWI